MVRLVVRNRPRRQNKLLFNAAAEQQALSAGAKLTGNGNKAHYNNRNANPLESVRVYVL